MKKHGILITGASRGLGRAMAIEFAKREYDLILTCKSNKDELVKLQKELEKYPVSTYILTCDFTDLSNIDNLYNKLSEAVKQNKLKHMPNIIINNAALSIIKQIQDTTIADIDNIINTNLKAPIYLASKFVNPMIHNKEGLIVNISSIWGKYGASMETIYSASKFGLEGLTKSLAEELKPSNIDVIGFRPGIIDTDMNKHFCKEDLEEIKKHVVGGIIPKPQEVANYIVDLICSKNYETSNIYDIPIGWLDI